jgi:hypothetical protein
MDSFLPIHDIENTYQCQGKYRRNFKESKQKEKWYQAPAENSKRLPPFNNDETQYPLVSIIDLQKATREKAAGVYSQFWRKSNVVICGTERIYTSTGKEHRPISYPDRWLLLATR